MYFRKKEVATSGLENEKVLVSTLNISIPLKADAF